MKPGDRASVVDIGSNSVKWIVAEHGRDRVHVLREESYPTRLAADLIRTGALGEAPILRTLEVFRSIHDQVEALGVKRALAVATSAVRDSSNRKSFIKRAREALGFPVRLLSGNEEAETIFSGVASDPYWKGRELFVVDVGGGSAEWIQGEGLKIAKRISLPLGCVRLKERFVKRFPIGAGGMERMGKILFEQLRPVLASYDLNDRILVGTGGTATCLVAIHQELKDFDPTKVDHYRIRRSMLQEMIASLQEKNLTKLKRVPGLPLKRTDLILPGAAVILTTMELLGANEFRASIRGLRYGVLNQLMTMK